MLTPSVDRVSENQIHHLLRVCELCPTPRTVGVWGLVYHLSNEWRDHAVRRGMDEASVDEIRISSARELIALPRPCDHNDHARYVVDRYVTEYLKKVEWLPLMVDRRAAALAVFEHTETTCKAVNERLRFEPEPSWFRHMRSVISRCLGPLDSNVISEINNLMTHGPGAAVGIGGDGLVASDKYRYPVTLTPALVDFAESLMGPRWFGEVELQVVPGSEWTTVPKNAKTDRGIATEPVLNMFCQLGLGRYVSRRLRRFGVDLSDQTWNQTLASVAEAWSLSTLDLKAASDCLPYEVVRSLLPPDWFRLFALFRSPMMKVNRRYEKLEKWSTMGNGYTFPLESLIFLAAINTVVPREEWCVCAVYGDDIIVPRTSAHAVIERLEYLGFQVNGEKSCLAGNFFESCGADYLRGDPCRPSFAPHKPGPVPKSVQTANGFRVWLMAVFGKCPARFQPIWLELVKQTPRDWRKTCVPLEWGDTGIIQDQPLGDWCVSDPEKDGYGWEGYLAKSVMFAPTETSRTDMQDLPVLFAGLRRIGADPESNPWTAGREPRRGLYGRPIVRFAFACRWTPGLDWQ